MKYLEFVERLKSHAEADFAAFQRRLIFTKYQILGVRTPTMRKIAKEFSADIEELLSYPDEYYETVFIKLTAISLLPFSEFVERVEYAVGLMDDWALCDSFKAKCIVKNRQSFLPVLERLFEKGEEYSVRYVLVALLSNYVEEEYMPLVKEYIKRADTALYYVRMATAWLVAEILVKRYDEGVAILKEGALDKETRDKAIRKAIESYRLNEERKEFLRSLKIK